MAVEITKTARIVIDGEEDVEALKDMALVFLHDIPDGRSYKAKRLAEQILEMEETVTNLS